jgi:hypothetical protein
MQQWNKMLTRQSPDGNWEVTGIPWSEIQGSLYGALCKLKDYEKTGLQPGQILEMNELYLEKCREVNALKRKDRWIPVEDEGQKPPQDKYILLSFENYHAPVSGRYDEDEDGGASFYAGDNDESCISQGLFVNAWRPLPERYMEEDDG